MPRLALRQQLFIALVVPAVLVVAVGAYLTDRVAQRALEEAMGDKLCGIAQSAATLVGPRIVLLERGDEESRQKKNAMAKLASLVEATAVDRILFVRLGSAETILDSRDELKIGDEYLRARFDGYELERVAKGESVASVLFEGPNGRPYKTGYAPLRDEDGKIAAFVGVNAKASFYTAVDELRATIGGITSMAFVILGIGAFLSARWVSVPLSALSRAAQRIGRGELDTHVPTSGPEEAWVLGDTMRSMASSLKARDEEMQMMLAGIAHEVRNPLGGIELFGGLLKEDLDATDPRRKHVDKILRELETLARVVNDFLHFARRTKVERRAVDVAELMEGVVAVAKRDAADRGTTVELHVEPKLQFHLDPEAIKRALLNLVKNAIQAVPKGSGRIRIDGRQEDGRLVLEVTDNGPGVPPEKREEIWKPFFTTKEKGTGLGLALVKKTVDAHDGSIGVEPADGGGARFVMVLAGRPTKT